MSIERLLSFLSSSKEIFEEAASYYEQSLSNCGYKEKLDYPDPTSPNLITKRKRQRNISWFNPPYSKTVKTKIGKVLFAANQKAFSKRAKIPQNLQQKHPEIKLLVHVQHQNKKKRT